MSVMVEYAMFPTDKGASVSEYVARIIKMLEESQLKYQLTPMGTVFECETMGEALWTIEKSYEALEEDCDRVYASIKFDIRKDRENGMEQKMESIKSKT